MAQTTAPVTTDPAPTFPAEPLLAALDAMLAILRSGIYCSPLAILPDVGDYHGVRTVLELWATAHGATIRRREHTPSDRPAPIVTLGVAIGSDEVASLHVPQDVIEAERARTAAVSAEVAP